MIRSPLVFVLTEVAVPPRDGVETLTLNCGRGAPAAVRARLDSLADRLGLSHMEAYELKVAVGEAVSNAVRHGCGFDSSKRITVRFRLKPEALVVEVSDDGAGFCPGISPDPSEPPDTGGMGVALMRRLVDKVEFEFSSGTTVRLTKNLRPKPQP